jgi:hypothetical protein
MKLLILLAVLIGVSSAEVVKRAAQIPGVWTALDQLRGKSKLSIEDISALLINAKAGEDYPNLSVIPEGNFDCGSVKQPGFYADVDTRCQVIRRCDINGNQSAYLCPNLTIFNQITLVCQWFWDVDCSKSKEFYDYSNSRLYQGPDVLLLDNEDISGESVPPRSAPLVTSAPVELESAPVDLQDAPQPKPAKKGKKKNA